ncbi:MAG: hypothetical protein GAK35_03008 [Herbaspirillum frisingense]|uniref:Uncharacterized protein n=1 Tax=Herbaspirillum frisingense TaxID=92645 RepID=A0A7V8FV29_9BURK|nr:MAG: hypothetical protein GAK35_03008 [Herbaspirillum frisingense]
MSVPGKLRHLLLHRRGDRSQIHHARQGGYEIRVIGRACEQGWWLEVQVRHGGRPMFRQREKTHLYPDFNSLRVAGLLVAYDVIDRLPSSPVN